jgi:glutathione S-transferase
MVHPGDRMKSIPDHPARRRDGATRPEPPMQIYGHPFSSYTQKALIALYENATPFDFLNLSPENPGILAEFARRWPIKRFPLLVDGDHQVMEASTIIEYLHLRHPGAVRMIPADPDATLEVRMLDRFFDNYIHTQVQKVVFNQIRPEPDRDPYGVNEARSMLDTAYAWLDRHMAGREWAAGDSFSLADCAAAPALFYADWVHEIARRFANVRAYRARLLARPSFARCVEEARPYRPLFPLGAPERD